jgi:hypothetical protein
MIVTIRGLLQIESFGTKSGPLTLMKTSSFRVAFSLAAVFREALKKLVTFSLSDGQKFANELGYIPLPKDVVGKSVAALGSIE